MAARHKPSEFGLLQLERLWHAVHGRPAPSSVGLVFKDLVSDEPSASSWRSSISDDHTPFEFSMQVSSAGAQIRLLAEATPKGSRGDFAQAAAEGRRLAEKLEAKYGADLSRFKRIEDLFLPADADADAAFAIWFAVDFDAEGRPSFKLYLNPLVHGARRAPALVEEMLDRLEYKGAWSNVVRAMKRGPELDELRFVALDLTTSERARVKVYGFHHDISSDDMAEIANIVPGANVEAVRAFVTTTAGGAGLLSAPRQAGTCLAFAGGEARPRTCTMHVPVRAFAGSDRIAHTRILQALSAASIPSQAYENALEALTTRPLDETSGGIAWASIQASANAPRVTVYLAPQMLVHEPSHPTVAPSLDKDSPESVVKHFEAHPITAHPFFQRIAREPFDIAHMTLLLLNVRIAITRDFARRLASVVGRVDDDDVRSILAKQLNDELGDGNPSQMHKLLYERFVDGLKPWAPPVLTDELLAPGRKVAAIQDDLYYHRAAYDGVGAALVMEVIGKQGDLFVAAQLRRGKERLSEPVLEWLNLHEKLEIDHANESMELAHMIPRGKKASLAARGALEVGASMWSLLDDVYALCYG